MLEHASRSRHIDPDRPPAAAGGLRSQVPDLVHGPRELLDCRQLQQAGRRERTRFFDRRSRAGIDLAASAITPGRQSLNRRAADGLRARFRLPLRSDGRMSQGANSSTAEVEPRCVWNSAAKDVRRRFGTPRHTPHTLSRAGVVQI